MPSEHDTKKHTEREGACEKKLQEFDMYQTIEFGARQRQKWHKIHVHFQPIGAVDAR